MEGVAQRRREAQGTCDGMASQVVEGGWHRPEDTGAPPSARLVGVRQSGRDIPVTSEPGQVPTYWEGIGTSRLGVRVPTQLVRGTHAVQRPRRIDGVT
ncbi:MAG: hypothetical protein EBS89_09150 [Proteobacteria bacterium]|nr:hypothetical protein [Pseudomonadota bacterium]